MELKKEHKIRAVIVLLFSLSFFGFVSNKLAQLQIYQHADLLKRGISQHDLCLEIEPKRGDIFDRKKEVLATSIKVSSIYGVPYEIENPKETAQKLAQILNMPADLLEKRFKGQKKFVWVKRKIDDELSAKVEALNIKGIGFLEESKRFYPKGKLLSHVLGFVGVDNKGLEGLELSLDQYLKGACGYRFLERDAAGRTKSSLTKQSVAPKDGNDVFLTIDEVIQYIAEEELDKVYKEYNAQGAFIIVMDPKSGEILALANRPTYDPNMFFKSEAEERRNRVVTDFFEPGSTVKALVGAAALSEEIVSLDEEFFCENGAYRIGRNVLHDSHPYSKLTFQQVIEKSSNIGIAKVSNRLGKDKLYQYMLDFGFGSKTKLGLRGEVGGLLYPPKRWSKFQTATVSMGQGIAVTGIQLVNALAAIANKGSLLKPIIIRRVEDENGIIILSNEKEVIKEVVSEEAADKITTALKGVVSTKGTARRASIDGFSVAGKTGTAQKVKEEGGYSHSDFIASFVGFVPAENPEVAILVVIDTPKPIYYGGVVAAPVFREVAKGILKYLGVAPDEKLVEDNKAA